MLGECSYLGIDVHRPSIQWCRAHIGRGHPRFRFALLRIQNDRYNAEGTPLRPSFHFPVGDEKFDIIIYLFSVFSHVRETTLQLYLGEFRRIIKPSGRLFFTAFI